MAKPRVDQLLVSATVGDAIFDEALFLRDILRRRGYTSDIFAQHLAPALPRGHAAPAATYRPQPADTLFFHYSIGSALNPLVLALDVRLALVYHNITPPGFLRGLNPRLAADVLQGRYQLPMFRERALLALADSEFNRQELQALGFTATSVLPLACHHNPDAPADSTVLRSMGDGRTNVLFVGRLWPNKKQDDLLRFLHAFRQLDGTARLVLVGSSGGSEGYLARLKSLATSLDLEAHVLFAGHVPALALRAYYRSSRLFVSMSEHEGFCVPLLEAMTFRVPVIAYHSTAVPETLGHAGILVKAKRWDVLAALAQTVLQDNALRQRIVDRGAERAADFSPAQVQAHFESQLELLRL